MVAEMAVERRAWEVISVVSRATSSGVSWPSGMEVESVFALVSSRD